MKSSSWLLVVLPAMIFLYLLLHDSSPSPVRTVETRLLGEQFGLETQKLQQILNRIVTEDGVVVLTIVDKTLARSGSVLDLFLKSFVVGEHTKRFLNQMLILAVDNEAFWYCKSKHHSCFLLTEPGMKSLTWRNEILLKILQLGYNIVFTHPDVMWLRNPIADTRPLAEITISCDFSAEYPETYMSDQMDEELFYIRSESRPIEFMKLMKLTRFVYPDSLNAPLCKLLQDNKFVDLEIEFFNYTRVGDFCEPSWDISEIDTIHASCCDDTRSKVHDMKLVLDDWNRFSIQSRKNVSPELSFNSWTASHKCKGR